MANKKGAAILAKEITPKEKIEFFKKEERSGKQKVFKGLQLIKRNIGKSSAMQGLLVVRQGNQQIRFAKREIAKVKFAKKYWK